MQRSTCRVQMSGKRSCSPFAQFLHAASSSAGAAAHDLPPALYQTQPQLVITLRWQHSRPRWPHVCCRPFDTRKAETLINGFTDTMTTVSPANINVLNIAKVRKGCIIAGYKHLPDCGNSSDQIKLHLLQPAGSCSLHHCSGLLQSLTVAPQPY